MEESSKDELKPQVFIVPRWSGNPHSDWYDWFGGKVKEKYGVSVKALAMPHWNAPSIDEATEFLWNELPELNESTILIGHSVGCLALLHFLHERLLHDPTTTIGGLILVAAWFEVDEAWDTVIPWLKNDQLPYTSLQENILYKQIIISDNDPFTSNYKRNSELWKKRLGAEVMLCPGRAHFNGKIENDVFSGFCEIMDNTLLKN
jgi:hypothetical protein